MFTFRTSGVQSPVDAPRAVGGPAERRAGVAPVRDAADDGATRDAVGCAHARDATDATDDGATA